MERSRHPGHGLKEHLERHILHGLSCEWHEAACILKPKHRNLLRPPLFRLADLKDEWGCWLKEKREICLSRDLVTKHSWDSVREVLIHEMAHQLADDVLHADGETSHGLLFQKACEMLRANPRASGKFEPLDQRIADDSATAEDRIMIKVKKLMALAESRNRHEAEAAMAKANAADVVMKATTEAVQIFGGYGYTNEMPVEKLMRDAKIYSIYEGASEIQRSIIMAQLIRGR